jgi:transglutaminase-like putative cysteine protease
MPEADSVVQRLLVSTVPDWQSVSKWYWSISAPHYDATTPDLIAKVNELSAGTASDREKVLKLFTFVSQQIRYMGITTETTAPGYEPHDVSTTFCNRYGVCRDKAALLVSMLRIAGLKGFPVLIHVGAKKDAGVPMPYFNHAIVCVQEADGTYQLMDPTDENAADLMPAYLSDKSYLVARPEGEQLLTSPIVPASKNMLHIDSKARLDAQGTMHLDAALRFDGVNDNSYRGYFATITQDERRHFFDERLGRIFPGAQIGSLVINPANLHDTSLPMTVQIGCDIPDYLVQSDSHSLLSLPWLGNAFGTVNKVLGQTGLEKRRFPLNTEIACGVEETIDLTLANDTIPLAVPCATSIERGDLEFCQSVLCASNHVAGAASFVLKSVEYSPEKYALLKQSLRDIEFARRQRIAFQHTAEQSSAPDAEIVRRDMFVEIKDAHEWTTTEKLIIRILSYAGKKRLSELHLDYNPVWETATVTNVIVTGADGKEHALAAQELNVMDAEWVGSAPRYPAAKTLVASLPAVEVGSELHYTIVRHVHDQPFFSKLATFRDFDPLDEATLTVSCPASFPMRELVRGDGLISTCTTNGGIVTHSWSITNQVAIMREDHLPPLWAFCPTVCLSAGNWPTYAAQMIDPMIKAAKGNPSARALARQIVHEAGTDIAKATAIRDAIDRAVRIAGPQANELPIDVLTDADRTLVEGYGNERDRALLLYVMLEETGFKPGLVLSSSDCPMVPELRDHCLAAPQRDAFDTVLVRAKINGQYVYFNDTDQYAQLGSTPHDGRTGLTAKGEQLTIEALPEEKNQTVTRQNIGIHTNGDAVIAVTSKFQGMNFASCKKQMDEQTPEDRRRFAQEAIATISQAAKLEGEFAVNMTNYPGSISFTVLVPRFAVRDGTLLYFNLPIPQSVTFPGQATERHNPFYDETHTTIEMTCDIALPPGELVVAPSTLDLSAPSGLAHALYTSDTSSAANHFLWKQAIYFQPAIIPIHRYDELKAWNSRVRHADNRAFMLKMAD